MKLLRELLAKKKKAGDVGIEIECEGEGFKEVFTEVWTSKDDPSLRGTYPSSRIEYILVNPIPTSTVKAAVTELNAIVAGAKPDFSFRTSVHVHTNILEMTSDQILSFIYTYILLEEALLNFCGNSRKCNRFCLRVQDCDGLITALKPGFQQGVEAFLGYEKNHVKYGSFNLASIRQYGSLEFRGMRGTLDVDTIDIWCNALISLRNFACNQKDVLAVHDAYITRGPEEFLKFVLGDLSKHFLYKNLVRDVHRNYSLAIDLPYVYKHREAALKSQENKKSNLEKDIAGLVNVRFNPPDFVGFAADPRPRGAQIPIGMLYDPGMEGQIIAAVKKIIKKKEVVIMDDIQEDEGEPL